jgi:hypothetical protein
MHTVFVRELEELITVGRKIDHPEISKRRGMEEGGDERGSKDVSDSVAGVITSLIGMPKKPRTGFVGITGDDTDHQDKTKEAAYKSSSGWTADQREYGKNYEINDHTDGDDTDD